MLYGYCGLLFALRQIFANSRLRMLSYGLIFSGVYFLKTHLIVDLIICILAISEKGKYKFDVTISNFPD